MCVRAHASGCGGVGINFPMLVAVLIYILFAPRVRARALLKDFGIITVGHRGSDVHSHESLILFVFDGGGGCNLSRGQHVHRGWEL